MEPNKPTTMSIALPEGMKAFVEAEVAQGHYASASEFLRELIRERQAKQRQAKSAGEKLDRARVREAIQTILDLQQKLTLKGLTVEDLINEGREL